MSGFYLTAGHYSFNPMVFVQRRCLVRDLKINYNCINILIIIYYKIEM